MCKAPETGFAQKLPEDRTLGALDPTGWLPIHSSFKRIGVFVQSRYVQQKDRALPAQCRRFQKWLFFLTRS